MRCDGRWHHKAWRLWVCRGIAVVVVLVAVWMVAAEAVQDMVLHGFKEGLDFLAQPAGVDG